MEERSLKSGYAESAKVDRECVHIARFFAPDYAQRIRWSTAGSYGLAEAVICGIDGSGNEAYLSHPNSIEEFAKTIGSVFSDEFLVLLAGRAREFNERAGVDGLADAFIQRQTVASWITEIVKALCCQTHTAHHKVPDRDNMGQQGTPNRTRPLARRNIEGSDALAHCALSKPCSSTGSGETGSTLRSGPCPIIQVDLAGPTIVEAWNANEITRAMEKDSRPSWMPGGQSIPVYHGTHAHILDTDVVRPARHYRFVAGMSGRHFGPLRTHTICGTDVEGTWTGFSPLRCFLWSVFNAEVITGFPVQAVDKLRLSWPCEGQGHVGIMLLKHQPWLPTPQGCTSTVRSEEGSCDPASNHSDHKVRSGERKPRADVVHSRETGSQADMLDRFGAQHWRTLWVGERAVRALNECHEATYAISFERTAVGKSECEGEDSVGVPVEEVASMDVSEDRDSRTSSSGIKGFLACFCRKLRRR